MPIMLDIVEQGTATSSQIFTFTKESRKNKLKKRFRIIMFLMNVRTRIVINRYT